MTYPDISTLTLRILATADAILMEPVKPPLSKVAVHGSRRYCAVRDILQAAFDEAMRPEPAASSGPPPPEPAAEAVVGIRRCLDALAECDRQEMERALRMAELVRGMMRDVAGLCSLPTKGTGK